jgi:hypothetical protein
MALIIPVWEDMVCRAGIEKSWQMKREMLSPAYTTRYADLPVAK